ncbi:type VII secretion system-associated protein [Nocardia sp. NPDC004568]|uniref:type VII secretion system-associated protein n=1 Tax=Nocardia sp. NPDC004568 TaxID=3154551 RepID=UPI0033B7DBBC
MNEAGRVGRDREDWVVQVDPRWEPAEPSQEPPSSMILGGWMLEGDIAGPFQPNPEYRPAGDDSPCDPVDAVVRRVGAGEDGVGVADVVSAVGNSMVDVGCDEHDEPLIGAAPDGVACIVVATAAVYRRAVDVERWNPILGESLLQVVPPDVDIMLNPEGPAPFRLRAEARGRR